MNRPQAIIFDVDGTLAETERDGHRPAFNQAFAEHGLDWHWDAASYGRLLDITGGKERIRHFAERHAPAIAAQPDFDDLVKRLHAAKTAHYVRRVDQGKLPLRPGVADLIAAARRAGIRLAIATTASPENVAALLRASLAPESANWFEAIGAGDVVPAKKPAPDIYHWVLERLGLPASTCLAIEDSANGLHAALAQGYRPWSRSASILRDRTLLAPCSSWTTCDFARRAARQSARLISMPLAGRGTARSTFRIAGNTGGSNIREVRVQETLIFAK